jgi:hypothetical protein
MRASIKAARRASDKPSSIKDALRPLLSQEGGKLKRTRRFHHHCSGELLDMTDLHRRVGFFCVLIVLLFFTPRSWAQTSFVITTTSLPDATLGVPYDQKLKASGGSTPYSWSLYQPTYTLLYVPPRYPPPGLTLRSDGSITGVPTKTGTYPFNVMVSGGRQTAYGALTIVVTPSPLTITTAAPIPGATAGVSYSFNFNGTGGVAPYTWRFAGVPPGMDSTSAGALVGMPRTPGKYPLTVYLMDVTGLTVSRPYQLEVNAPLSVVTSALPGVTVGSDYSQTFSATGGTPGYSWAISDGALPPGVGFDSSGYIKGTPTHYGLFSFTVVVTDAARANASRALSLNVAPPPLVITTNAALPDGTVGVDYTFPLQASGGVAPYRWSFSPGSEVAGVSLNGSGVLSGTPSRDGTITFTVQVSDSLGGLASKTLNLRVTAPSPPPEPPEPADPPVPSVPPLLITSAERLPEATVGQPYSFTFTVSGGAPPYRWSSSPENGLAGLTLNAEGVLSGTPEREGESTFRVRVTDAVATATTASVILVFHRPADPTPEPPAEPDSPPPQPPTPPAPEPVPPLPVPVQAAALTVTTEPPLSRGRVGVAYQIALQASGGAAPYLWKSSGNLPPGLTLSPAGNLSGTPSVAGQFDVVVSVTDGNSSAARKTLQITVDATAMPRFVLTGVPDTSAPEQQHRVGLNVADPASTALTGRLRLAFAPDAANPADDPAVQFSTGGRAIDVAVSQGGTSATFAPAAPAVLTGTVSGTITVSIDVSGAGSAVLRQTRVNRMPPRILSAAAIPNESGFAIRIVGYSTSREMQRATFTFGGAAGANLRTTEIPVEISQPFTTWYQDAASAAFGSTFEYVQPFQVQGDRSAIASVTVTLTNSSGSASFGPLNANFQR